MSTTEVRTRFAPSPTGYLHVGGARTALFNWLYARHHGGKFILRVEDTDEARNTDEAKDAILAGMNWLGLDWDEGPGVGGDHGPYYQSERSEIYDTYLAKLEEAGLVYEDDRAIRFRVPDRDITVNDEICGTQNINLHTTGSKSYDQEKKQEIETNPDLVIRRPDGGYIFHFVNVVDDITMGITHILRGEDHLSNTAKHIALFEALGAPVPVYAHIPLILNADGSKMSKRDQGAAVGEYQDLGFLPEAVTNYLSLLGWSPKDDSEKLPLAELIERFDLGGINRANAKFDLAKCTWLNSCYLNELSPEDFAQAITPHLPSDTPPEMITTLAQLFQTKIQTASEIKEASAYILTDTYENDIKAVDKLKGRADANDLLTKLHEKFSELMIWDADQIGAALENAANQLEVKKGALMFPARVATSGRGGGPDLMPMIEAIGKDRTLARITQMKSEVA